MSPQPQAQPTAQWPVMQQPMSCMQDATAQPGLQAHQLQPEHHVLISARGLRSTFNTAASNPTLDDGRRHSHSPATLGLPGTPLSCRTLPRPPLVCHMTTVWQLIARTAAAATTNDGCMRRSAALTLTRTSWALYACGGRTQLAPAAAVKPAAGPQPVPVPRTSSACSSVCQPHSGPSSHASIAPVMRCPSPAGLGPARHMLQHACCC
jgi:hypothetical protein